ncbi:Chondroitinase-AC precursor [compost metagenome]
MPVSLDSPAQGEGIRLDYSFSQHNPVRNGHVYSQLYAGGYGIELLNTVFEFMATLSGAFSLKWEAIFYIERFLENGIARFAYKGFCDFHVCGRRISRSTPGTWGWEQWNRLLQNEYVSNQTDGDGHKGLNVLNAEDSLFALTSNQQMLQMGDLLMPLLLQIEQRHTLRDLKDLLDWADPEDLLGLSFLPLPLAMEALESQSNVQPGDRTTQRKEEKASKQWFAHSVGNRAYWLNDYMTHFTPDFALFTKTASTRTVGTETGNGENLKGYYMGCGSYFVVASGEEYKGIQPLWEWQQLPGTTVEQIPNFTYPLVQWGQGAWGSHDFSGVLSDGECGIASMELTKGNIKNARKSVVALQGSVICLGSAGNHSSARHPVHTTVNQSWFNREVVVKFKNGTTQSLTSGTLTRKDISEVTHDGFRYRFLNVEQNVTIDITTRTGAWKDINSGESDALVRGIVFSLWVNHAQELNDKYCYEISRISDAKPQDIQIVLTDDAHIVTCPELQQVIGSTFTGPSPAVRLGDFEMTLLSPLTFRVVSYFAEIRALTVADLTQKLEKTTVCMKLGSQEHTLTITLPNKGETRGKSVTLTAHVDQHAGASKTLTWQ